MIYFKQLPIIISIIKLVNRETTSNYESIILKHY